MKSRTLVWLWTNVIVLLVLASCEVAPPQVPPVVPPVKRWNAFHPHPEDGTTGFNSRGDGLTWEYEGDVTQFSVFFGTSPSLGGDDLYKVVKPVVRTVPGVPPPRMHVTVHRLLDVDTTYYWRVDVVRDSSVEKGDTWRFTTGGWPPGRAPFQSDQFSSMILASDATAFEEVSFLGRKRREIELLHPEDPVVVNAHVYRAVYRDELMTELVVTEERSGTDLSGEAGVIAERWAVEFGRLPQFLRAHVGTIVIRVVDQITVKAGGYASSKRGIVYVVSGDGYAEAPLDPFARILLIHEAAHVIDRVCCDSSGADSAWRRAQIADGGFITAYGEDVYAEGNSFGQQPGSLLEDFADSVVVWVALRQRRDRFPESWMEKVESVMENRIVYLDGQFSDANWCAFVEADCSY